MNKDITGEDLAFIALHSRRTKKELARIIGCTERTFYFWLDGTHEIGYAYQTLIKANLKEEIKLLERSKKLNKIKG